MKQKIDFIIRYEHKVRELESIMLLKLELERRGYTVGLVCNYDYKSKKDYKPKVIVVPAAYKPEHIIDDMGKYGCFRKIANLQWEQLFESKNDRNLNSPYNIRGICLKIKHFLWGQEACNRLQFAHLPKENALKVGSLNTDLLRGGFKKSLISKHELAQKYSLDENSKWFLFISTFAYCELDDLQLKLCRQDCGEESFNYFMTVCIKSRNEILRWFRKALLAHPDITLIYRPHPDEARKSEILREMEKKYPNFRVIQNLAMKHWINSCDKIYNWYSTGQIDVTMLHKPYRFLRPVEIKKEVDYSLFFGIDTIKDEQCFLNDYVNFSDLEIISKERFASYYYIPENYVYLNIADILEKMLLTKEYDAHYNLHEWYTILSHRVMYLVCHHAKKMLSKRISDFILEHILHEDHSVPQAIIDGYAKNVASEEEINQIANRIKPMIYGA
ncbi:MAG: hypothetical protein WCR36_07740 [Bacteroidaceae bacterium]|jgi:hypothetical protein